MTLPPWSTVVFHAFFLVPAALAYVAAVRGALRVGEMLRDWTRVPGTIVDTERVQSGRTTYRCPVVEWAPEGRVVRVTTSDYVLASWPTGPVTILRHPTDLARSRVLAPWRLYWQDAGKTAFGGTLLLAMLLVLRAAPGVDRLAARVLPFVDQARREFTVQDAVLITAATNGDVLGVRQALADGGRVNAAEPEQHETPLTRAAANGHTAVVQQLLTAGADVNQRGPFKRTALHEAAMTGTAETARALLGAGADPDLYGGDRDATPLFLAVHRAVQASPGPRASGDAHEVRAGTEIVGALLAGKANPALGREAAESPLSSATEFGLGAIVRALVDAGAPVSDVDPGTGKTPLTWAAGTCYPDTPKIVAALLEKGASPAQTDGQGRSALDVAQRAASSTTNDRCQAVLADVIGLLRGNAGRHK